MPDRGPPDSGGGESPIASSGRKSLLAVLILLLSCCFSVSSAVDSLPAPTADAKPFYVRENDEGPTLQCLVPAEFRGDNFEVQWIRYTKGALRTISRNSKLLERKHFELFNDPANGRHDLKIKKVSRDETAGMFHCSVLNTDDGQQQMAASADVTVLIPPGEPTITKAPTTTVREGDGITFKCASIGGSPTPSFSWLFHNNTRASAELHSQQIHGETVESTIHWRATPDDHNAFVTCAVTNLALADDEELSVKSPRLNVLYSPRVTVGPDREYAVEAGQPVQLMCMADSNPRDPSFEWKHLASGQRYANANWPFMAEKTMAGDFECRVRNTVGEGVQTVSLQVQYAPEVTVKEVVNPSEGEAVLVECAVDALPREESIEWRGPGGFVSRGTTLSLPSVTRAQSGNYTCTATNYLTLYGETGTQPRSGNATTLVDVKRRPGRGVVTPWALPVVVGGTIELDCAAVDPGSPAASFKWASPSSGGQYGTREHTRAELTIRNAQLADNGEYRCIPYNSIGEGEPGVARVMVVEPASISRPMATERIFGEGDAEQELSCEARGYPIPEIRWSKDGQPLESQDAWQIDTAPGHSSCSPSDFCSQSVTSTLRWTRPVVWSDKGNYSCVALNGAAQSEAASATWTLARVIHGPVILNDLYPEEALAAADVGATAKISCRVSARPEPTFVWLHDSAEIIDGGRFSIQVTPTLERPDEFESTLYIAELTDADYGAYLCRSMNGKGEKADVVIRLRKKSLPQSPDHLQRLAAAASSLHLAWRPGFDGGLDQAFLIEYRLLNPFTGSVADEDVFTVDVKNATLTRMLLVPPITRRVARASQQRGSTASSLAGVPLSLVTYNLTGLRPLSTYYVRVRAANKLGHSDFTPIVVSTTTDAPMIVDLPTPSSLNYLPDTGTFISEPAPPADTCLLLYVSTGEQWRAVDCFAANHTISDVPSGGERFKARFCRQNDKNEVTGCGAESKPLVATSMFTPPFKLAFVVPLTLFCLVLAVVVVVVFCCCRYGAVGVSTAKRGGATLNGTVKKAAKNGQKIRAVNEERPEVSGPMPAAGGNGNSGGGGELTKTPAHGSATADSGVFTLDSSNGGAGGGAATTTADKGSPASDTKHVYVRDRIQTYSSNETGVDVWPPPPSNSSSSSNSSGHHSAPLTSSHQQPTLGGHFDYSAAGADGGGFLNDYNAGSNMADCATTATTSYDEDDEDGDEAYASGGRRTLREIIV